MSTIAIAADHGGVEVKAMLKLALEADGYAVLDLGTNTTDSVDYPDYADAMADVIKDGSADKGILICGTGIGISIAANRHKHIRAALCSSATDGKLARQHNDANVVAIGARTMGDVLILDIVSAFLTTEFDGGERHARRVEKLSN